MRAVEQLRALAISNIVCPTCGVKPESNCRNTSKGYDYPDSYVHTPRLKPLQKAFDLGTKMKEHLE